MLQRVLENIYFILLRQVCHILENKAFDNMRFAHLLSDKWLLYIDISTYKMSSINVINIKMI